MSYLICFYFDPILTTLFYSVCKLLLNYGKGTWTLDSSHQLILMNELKAHTRRPVRVRFSHRPKLSAAPRINDIKV